MVLIAGGPFVMNRLQLQYEQVKIDVDTFYLDQTEVTVSQYLVCVGAGVCTDPELGPTEAAAEVNWHDPELRANHPINCVQWAQSHTFCQWAGKRLPTEAEWEYAARGEHDAPFPWGRDPAAAQSCWNGPGNDAGLMQRRGTCPVASYPMEANGLFDMSGNVIEWTHGKYCQEKAQRGYQCEEERRALRGGHWQSRFDTQMTGTEAWILNTTAQLPFVGFRCAL